MRASGDIFGSVRLYFGVVLSIFLVSSARVSGGKHPVRLEDIVIAYPADDRHVVVAKASRVWRKGIMRTYIALNHPPTEEQIADGKLHNETWGHYPDDNPRRSMYPGDSRAGLVPFLAHQVFGDTYKWLLYMDDDTIFFPDAVQRLLEDFDPDLPYFITDHLWWPDPKQPPRLHISNHPNKEAPRCLPCHFDTTPYKDKKMPFPAPKGCPCTPQLLCDAAAAANMTTFNRFCDMPRAPFTVYSMHGGAGGIMSIGLMRSVSFDWMEKCTKSLYSTGGDAFISICLWQAGYAITDPGLGLFIPDLQYFDPGPEDRIGAMLRLSQFIDNSATKQCDKKCEMQLEHMVSLHVRSRKFETLEDAAAFIRGVSILYEVFADIRYGIQRREAEAAAAKKAAAALKAATAAGMGVDANSSSSAAQTGSAGAGAVAAVAVAAATEAALKEVGPDGRPLSQSEVKQKELALAQAQDAAAHQNDHRNATSAAQHREEQKQSAAAHAAESKELLRAAQAVAANVTSKRAAAEGQGAAAGNAAEAQQQVVSSRSAVGQDGEGGGAGAVLVADGSSSTSSSGRAASLSRKLAQV